MKKNIISIIIIVTLSIVVFFLLRKPVKTTDTFDGKLLQADSLKVIEFTFEQGKNRILLSKGLDKWMIKEPKTFEPDPNIPRTILQFAHDITLKNIISDKPEKFSKFGADSTGIILTIRKEDNSKISYIIGGDDQERNYSFYRIPGDNRIYLGTLFPRYRITANVNDWRNKSVSNANIMSLSAFSMRSGSDVLEVSRLNEGWKALLNGTETAIGKEIIDPVAGKLASFKAIDLVDSLNLNNIAPSIIVNYSSGNSEIEIILSKTTEGFTAFRKDKNQGYKIQETDYAVFENLLKK